MAKKMLIDATHPEETRVVVLHGKRLEEFDYESASRKQLKGNIYLAKVTRVEPSLQAAFVDYGGNRHGFLAFSEIHPDYYRIPVADREALLAEEAELDAAEAEEERRSGGGRRRRRTRGGPAEEPAGATAAEAEPADAAEIPAAESADETPSDEEDGAAPERALPLAYGERLAGLPEDLPTEPAEAVAGERAEPEAADEASEAEGPDRPVEGEVVEAPAAVSAAEVETVGGDEAEAEEVEVERRRNRPVRRYKIQEVIKRRQIMLVQVTKEERGNKGAALTTYLSLAGRYCVLMPNTARGGGVSRKITNANDRKRLKSIIEEMEIPDGMAVIVRTAGSERSRAEVRRDYEYLIRLWDEIRELTLKSTAPALIYEEANLIKRSIRDLYSKDIEDIVVEGDEGYKAAKAFMKMLTPSHARRVQQYKDPAIPLFQRYQVESQIDAIHNPVVQLKSGGYIVINPTEALVAIDVNSGRATRERNIEETALRTNLEAADEVARQLRLRDLAGLIVVDFIDMEEPRHNAAVERRLKEAMRHDRARIQLGRISHFGLLELSRQRLRPSLLEASTELCRQCRGTGYVRSTESTALHVLRSIEEEGIRHRDSAFTVAVPTAVALYVLNQKRKALTEIESRHNLQVHLAADDSLIPPEFRLERVRALAAGEEARQPISQISAPLAEEEAEAEAEEDEVPAAAREVREEGAGEERPARRRSRRRRRRREDDQEAVRPRPAGEEEAEPELAAEAARPAPPPAESDGQAGAGGESEASRRRRRRGRRGGRRRARRGEAGETTAGGQWAEEGGAGSGEGESGGGEAGPFEEIAEETAGPAPEAEPATDEPEAREEPTPPSFVPPQEPAHRHGGNGQHHADEPESGRMERPSELAREKAEPARQEARDTERGHGVTEDTAGPSSSRRGWWKRLVE